MAKVKTYKCENGITVILHASLRSCMAAYFECKPSEAYNQDGYWEWRTASGEDRRMSYEDALKSIKKIGVWGWVGSKEYVHLWISRKASLYDILCALVHEFGHVRRPYHKGQLEEERKAEIFRDVFAEAFSLIECLMPDIGMELIWRKKN